MWLCLSFQGWWCDILGYDAPQDMILLLELIDVLLEVHYFLSKFSCNSQSSLHPRVLHSCGRTSDTLFHILIRKKSNIGRDNRVWNSRALQFSHCESSSEAGSDFLILFHGFYPLQIVLHLFLRGWPKEVKIVVCHWSRCRMRHPALPDWLLRRHPALICSSNSSKHKHDIFAWYGSQNPRKVI